jgi:hypothetical protein
MKQRLQQHSFWKDFGHQFFGLLGRHGLVEHSP